MLAAADSAVVQTPQLRSLRYRIPLPEVAAEREDSLLGPRALLVAPVPAEHGTESVLCDRVEQRDGLEPVPRRPGPSFYHSAAVDRLHGGHDQPLAELGQSAIAELDRLGEIVASVHVHDREREADRPERLLGQTEQDGRVLAARKNSTRL